MTAAKARTVQPVHVSLSVFARASATSPGEVPPMAWQAFVNGIREGLQRTVPAPLDDSEQAWQRAKRNLPGFVCAAFDGPRGNDTVGDHTALVIDVDRTTPDLLARLERYQAVAYETPSSRRKRPDDLRLRVVVALTEPVPPHAVAAARAALAVVLGLDPDASGVAGADAASQIMFIGRVDGTPERRLWSYDGQPWTPPPPGEAPPPRDDRASTAGASEPLYGPDLVPDLSALAPLIEPEEPGGMRRSSRKFCRGLGGGMAREGIHPDAIETCVFALHDGRSDQPAERAALAREAAERFYAGDARAAGMSAVREHVAQLVEDPDDVVAYIRRQCLGSWERKAADVWTQYIAERRAANDVAEPATATEPAPQSAEEGFWSFDFFSLSKPPDMLCERLGIVAEGGRVNAFIGAAGSGKTWSAMSLGFAMATGTKVFGAFDCRAGVVRHIDSDMSAKTTKRRYVKLARGLGMLDQLRAAVDDRRLGVMGPLILTSNGKPDARAYARLQAALQGVDLLIVDSLRRIAPGIDENSAAFAEVLAGLRHVSTATGTAVVMIHHTGKSLTSKAGMGTSALDGEWGTHWVIEDGEWTMHKAHGELDALCEPFATTFERTGNFAEQASPEGGGVVVRVVGVEEATASAADVVWAFIARHGFEGCSQRDVEQAAKGFGLSQRAARAAVADLLRTERAYRSQGANGASSQVVIAAQPSGK